MKRNLAWVCAAVLVLAGSVWSAEKPAGKPEDSAQAAAEKWLKLIDGGEYDKSWDEAAQIFKSALTQEQWNKAVGSARGPLGRLGSRRLKSRDYTEKLPGVPDGKYVVIQYEAVFEKRPAAVETITPMLDADGTWRVSGYFVR